MQRLDAALEDYRKRREEFVWHVPPAFNFARDVVDRFAIDPTRPAALYRDAAGNESRFTFGQMSGWIHQFAGLLEALEVARGERVIVLLPRIPEWQIATVGTLASGAVAVPTSMAVLSPRDIQHRVNHSQAVMVVATPDAVPMLDQLRGEMPSLKHYLVVTDGKAAPPGWIDFNQALVAASPSLGRDTLTTDPALVFYTSGTTGKPKAVLHNHTYTYTGTRQASIWHGIRPDDRFWPTTGWAKAAFGPWSVGAEIVIVNCAFNPAEELALLESLAPNVFCAPPTQYRLMAKHGLDGIELPKLRQCVAAGEPLNPEIIRAWKAATGVTIRDGYGQSEAGLLIANLAGLPERTGSMGLPLPGYHIAVIDEAGAELEPNTVGELAVKYPAPGLFMEYWKNPEATARCKRGDWYLTGDRGSYDEEGFYWFVGRSDDVIISGSLRIGPFEVESLLVEHPSVVEAAAVAYPDDDLGHVIKAFVVLRPGAKADEALIASLRSRFAQTGDEHKMPALFEFVSDLPKTPTGKVKRAELRALA
ncbi:MAG: AMP-dependent synthetase and ligase [Rhodospirillales bacterium]|nr:AMP-dependent synthetase and ligase [Rhodospirillales bacterium]